MLGNLNFLLMELSYLNLGYETKMNNADFRYGLLASLARNAHCDGAFMEYSLTDRPKSDYESSCGMACRDLQQYMGSTMVKVKYGRNVVDHTQFIFFHTNVSVDISSSVASQTFASFRGTIAFDIVNMRRNVLFKFSKVTACAGCDVHQGFWRNWLALRPSFCGNIDEEGVKEMTTVGMSMGAPLATFAGLQAAGLGVRVRGIVTFGMPRVANAAFATAVISQITQGIRTVGVAYGRDPVPHVPPRFLGYTSTQGKLFHVLQEYLLTAEMQESKWNTRKDDHDFGNYFFYDKVYLNTATFSSGDKDFAGSIVTFDFNDHLNYFDMIGVEGCGYDTTENTLWVTNVAELFYL